MDVNDVINWGASVMRSFYASPTVSLTGCTPELPSRPAGPATASSVETPPAADAESAVCEWNQEEAVAYLRANETLLQQLMEEFCVAEPHYYIGTQVNALSQMRGRQEQTITGLIIHGAPDDIDLSDAAVLSRIQVSFGEGIEVNNIRVENNELVVDLVIDQNAAAGKRAVTISLRVPTDAGQPQIREMNVLNQENGFEVRARSSRRRGGSSSGGSSTPTPTNPPAGNPFEL